MTVLRRKSLRKIVTNGWSLCCLEIKEEEWMIAVEEKARLTKNNGVGNFMEGDCYRLFSQDKSLYLSECLDFSVYYWDKLIN